MHSTAEFLRVFAPPLFKSFLWPMLWQSSLLIGLLFVLDLVLRRSLRPAVRYALWLVVLIKLVVPPSLALPTGIAWWLRPSPALAVKPQTTSYTVNYGPAVLAEPPTQPATVFATRPEQPLPASAWALLASVVFSLALKQANDSSQS